MSLTTHFGKTGNSPYLLRLYQEFEESDILGDKFFFPERDGAGHVKNVFLEEDFCIRFYNFTLLKTNYFHWFLPEESDDPLYQLVITCGPEGVCDPGENSILFDESDNTTLYYPGSLHPEWIAGNTRVLRILFLFSRDWLIQNFSAAAEKLSDSMVSLGQQNLPLQILVEMKDEFYTKVREVMQEMQLQKFPAIHIKTKSLWLMNEFLNSFMLEDTPENQRSIHHESIKMVEKQLRNYLNDSLPKIETLAASVNMSPSTLQRHFKIVYGKNIYNYYLEQKFMLGKELIESGSKSVSEVAYALGYQKINSFSKIFKKIFGILPRDY